jgi:hypothetical protein
MDTIVGQLDNIKQETRTTPVTAEKQMISGGAQKYVY